MKAITIQSVMLRGEVKEPGTEVDLPHESFARLQEAGYVVSPDVWKARLDAAKAKVELDVRAKKAEAEAAKAAEEELELEREIAEEEAAKAEAAALAAKTAAAEAHKARRGGKHKQTS